jgi:hypothetical protein
MPAKKKISPQAKPFLETAAEAIGTALGKLAVKTGVATPAVASRKRAKAPIATKKKVVSPRKKAVKKSTR